MKHVLPGSGRRLLAGMVMVGLAVLLIALSQALGPASQPAHDLLLLLLWAAAVMAILPTIALSASDRAAWGRSFMVNGMLSVALAGINIYGQSLWPADPLYEEALNRAMAARVNEFVWVIATYFGAAILTIVAAAILFALSYWLLHSSGERHHQT